MTAREGMLLPDWLDVSRETLSTLQQFVALVNKWTPAINLVSRRSVPEIWERHILDSAQLFEFIPKDARQLVDLGSGGGFPGVVLAILARELLPDVQVTLVEADLRKATFLSQAARQLFLPAVIAAERIETLVPQHADVVTARALAPMATLCAYVHRHLDADGVALIAKGSAVDRELAEVSKVWSFDLKQFASRSDPQATTLVISGLRHV